MAVTCDFTYERPESLKKALDFLAKNKALVLAGGTDITVRIKEKITTPEALLDIKAIKELAELTYKNGELSIGALVTFTELLDSPLIQKEFPMLSQTAKTVACVGIRNRATLVGNICCGMPSVDAAPLLLVYEAEAVLESSKGKRVIPMKDFFTGLKKTALKPDELVTKIIVKKPKEAHAGLYVKLGRYRGEDIAQSGLGILLTGKDYKVAACSVAIVPKRLPEVEKILSSTGDIEKAKAALEKEISPITDIRATKEYRMEMTKVMLERGVAAVKDLKAGKKVDISSLMGG